MITQIPGGLLASRFGAKYVMLLGIGIDSLFSVLTPLFIQLGGATALIAVRIIMGLGEGVLQPACNTLIAAWTPRKERSRVGAIVFAGTQVKLNLSFFNN